MVVSGALRVAAGEGGAQRSGPTGGAAAGFVYLRLAPSTFISYASMWEPEKLRLPEGGMFTGDEQNYLGTQVELLRSSALSQLAIQRLQESGTNTVPKDKDGSMIQAQVSINLVPKSSILSVSVVSPDAAFSQAYLGALLDAYLEFKKNLKKSVSDYTLASISEQVLRLERELKDAQNTLTDFERTNNLAVLQEEGNVSGAYLAKLDTELSDSQLELKLLEANEAAGKADGKVENHAGAVSPQTGAGQVQPSSNFSGDQGQTAAREIAMLKIEREKLSKFLRPKHPKIVKLDADIERAQKLDELFRTQDKKQLEASRQALRLRIAGLQTAVHEWEGKVMKANSGIGEADRLKLNVNRTQVVYDRLLGLLQNIDISRNIAQESLAILQPATPASRSRKKEEQRALSTVLAGLFAGLGIVLLIAWRDDRFTSLSEMNDRFGDAILGQVPELPRLNGKLPLPLLQIDDDRPMYAESYRSLRSALLFMPTTVNRPKVILITSAMPHEGKSTVASNLARTLALGGSRVVLIDADLRRGHLHELLKMKREPGLSELLQHPENLDETLQSNCLPNLSFLSCGRSLSRPGDHFIGPAFDLLLARLKEQFDFVIVDTSPVFASDDASTLAPRVDGTIFVVRRGFSRSGPVAEALEVLSRRQAKMLGVVINGADSSANSYYYYKHEEYYLPLAVDLPKVSGKAGETQQPRPT